MSILKSKHSGWTWEGKRTPFGGGGKGGGAPPPPNYAAMAQQTAAGNLAAARQATAANRVNQVTPYGNLSYSITGEDPYGNPTWTATQTLSPEQQQLLDYQNQTSIGLGELAGQGLGYVSDMLNTPFDTSNLAEMRSNVGQENFTRAGNAPNLQTSIGENAGMAGWDRASDLMMQRLDPQLERQQEQQDAKLAAQGIPVGSKAYTRAKQDLAMQQNDLRTQAQLQAQNVQQNMFGQELQAGQFGNQALMNQNATQLQNLGFNNQQIQQMFANQMANANLSNQARQQGLSEQAYLRNEPLNTLSAVRTGSQVTGPQYVNSFNQATTQGADLLGAGQMDYNAQMGGYNADQAAQNSMYGGLMNLAGAGIIRYSDIRLKQNIKPVGVLENGLTLYSYEYIDKVKYNPMAGEGMQFGVMAQEVEQVYPYAVTTLDDGYKTVNYGLLP
jgi:hypothetical protein